MKFPQVLAWMPALLVLGGCPGKPPEPTKTPHLAAVSVSCAPNPVTVGGTSLCTASATDQDGQAFSVSGYTWSSSDTTVATVDAQGAALGVAVGTATLSASATADGVTQAGTAALTVNAKPTQVHSAPITSAETWDTDKTHLVRGQLTVDSGAVLTLAPGADVRFEPDAELRVRDGAIQAAGTAQAPILLTANGSTTPGTWRGVVLASNKSVSRWSFVTLRQCGKKVEGEDTDKGACLKVLNQAAPVLQDVTVGSSGGDGVKVADDGSAFGAGSARLGVTGSAGYAVRLGANQASTLPPASTFTGNAPNAIELTGNVTRTQTWPTPSVPYVLNGDIFVNGSGSVYDPGPYTTITLTLSAGMVLRFGPEASLNVGPVYPATGAGDLVVDGTQAAPVRFTADSDSPVPGYWKAVQLQTLSNNSRISHALFEYGGSNKAATLLLAGDDTGPSNYQMRLNDVVVQKGQGPGLAHYTLDFSSGSGGLTLRENGFYGAISAITSVGSFLTDTVFDNNTPNGLFIEGVFVTKNTTWHKLSVPYYTNALMDVVGDNGNTVTLTIDPGVEIRFEEQAGLRVGQGQGITGVLIAKGTASAPIRFVPVPSAQPFWWGGLHLWHAAGSQLDHIYVQYGGGLYRTADASEGVFGDGGVNFYREIGPVLTNSTVDHAYGHAINGSEGRGTDTTKVTTQYFDAQYNNTATNCPANTQGTSI